MAHKTLVGGTAYSITGGKSMVSGTSYSISGGKTLIGGTGYSVGFGGSNEELSGEAYAHVYSDNSLVFKRNNDVEVGKTLRASFTGFEDTNYSYENSVPWYNYHYNIINIFCREEIAPTSIAYWFSGYKYLAYVNYKNFNMNKVTNMAHAYNGCYNFKNSPVCGSNVVDMTNAYQYCNHLTGSPACGDNVIIMDLAYQYCNHLTGSPVCGNNVVNMRYTYRNCHNLTGSPACGEKVETMQYTYYYCNHLTGSPVCGNNVTNMSSTYWNCHNLTGSPACGEKVTNMESAYRNCYKLTGSPVCGNNVTNMSFAYENCRNLTGSPVCGEKVTNMSKAYYNCQNIGNNGYFYSSKVANIQNCFYGKNNSKRLNIYVLSNSTTNTRVHYTNTKSLVGATITWTNAGTYQYNATYNIYIYPVANVAAARVANGD